jgi:AcrR family transcriptional regulator
MVAIAKAAPEPENPSRGDSEERVLTSAVHLFSVKGYDGTSIREIIEDAGVTRPVLYYYFKNKEDLFCQIIEREFERHYRNLDDIIAAHTTCRACLHALVTHVFARVEESPETVRMMVRFFLASPDTKLRLDREQLEAERIGRIVRIMQVGLDQGEILEGDPVTLAVVFSGLVDMHVMGRGSGRIAALTSRHGVALVNLFFFGINSPEVELDTLGFRPGEQQ